jgi:type VI secretion system protein ImpF
MWSSEVAGVDRRIEIVPSLIDRLLDENPEVRQEAPGKYFQDVRGLERSVMRDLENLLNTRREALFDLPEEFNELKKSLLVYGLPDVTAYNLLDPNDRNRLRRAIEAAISAFESRLQRVRVSMTTPGQTDGALHFRIEAQLRVEPSPEPVTFDTILQLDTQKYSIRA